MENDSIISPVDGAPASRITKNQVLVLGIIAGLAMALTLVGVVFIALKVNDVQQADIRRNQRSIDRLNKVTNDLKKLTHPTQAQYRQQLQDGFKRCSKEPQCRLVLKKLLRGEKNINFNQKKEIPPAGVLAQNQLTSTTPKVITAPQRQQQVKSKKKSNSSPPPQNPTPQPPQGSPGPPAPPPQQPGPVINIKAPLVPAICKSSLIGINC